ncbi:AcrR family transcriptional regulator [Mycobacterium sp. MAA66]|uniref:TetR family transcriptional regulator n=1 Tax=Mycobacterium sp. MAA66 TaxID=3156297 RepID=UPI00351447C3
MANARDSDATRARLLSAATAEFARYGIAGARVDRIAAEASANKAQIYHYFGSKDQLFDAVWADMLQRFFADSPVVADNLPGYAAHLIDVYARQPEVGRLIAWHRLERGDSEALGFPGETMHRQIASIAAAQAAGTVSRELSAPVLFTLVLTIASMWHNLSPTLLAVIDIDDHAHRKAIVCDAVTRLIATTGSDARESTTGTRRANVHPPNPLS